MGLVLSPVNDIAVVTLDRDLRRPGLVSVCLPNPSSPVSLSNKLTVAGWGTNTTHSKGKSVTKLQFAEVDVTLQRECQRQYSEVLRRSQAKVEIKDSMLCAGGRDQDTCRGDSGYVGTLQCTGGQIKRLEMYF